MKLQSPVSSRPSTDEDLDEFVDDTFDKMPVNTSDASENTMDDSNTTLNDLLDADRDGKGRLLSQKEASPDITVDLADFEETVSQKDADSEKVLLRNKREDHETNLQPGSSISEPDKVQFSFLVSVMINILESAVFALLFNNTLLSNGVSGNGCHLL